MKLPSLPLIGATLSLFFSPLSTELWGCGLDWAIPHNHFDGVNERGNLSYWEKIGDLDLGDGLTVPLIMGFNSARTYSSPYLGDGWFLAMLESNIVQVDNRHFMMTLPDGLNIRLKRKNEADTTLTGQSGWMAALGENTATLWAQCGWKIVFANGKIASITTPQNQQLTYVYQNGVVQEIDKDGVPVLSVITDSNGTVSGLSFNGKQIKFEEGEKPNVENINSQNVIGHISSSLAKVTLADGRTDSYKFAVDSKMIPTLTISGAQNRFFSWDPSNRLLLKDGDWSYNIVPGINIFDNAQITRKNKEGQSEYWYDDKHTGEEITRGLDGIETKVSKFLGSDVLSGNIKTIEKRMSGKLIEVDHFSYDENGSEIRFSKRDGNGALLLQIDRVVVGPHLCKITYTTSTTTTNLEVPYDSGS